MTAVPALLAVARAPPRSLKRAELCVSESVANNRQLRAHVDHLRKELGIFKKGRHKVDEKDAAITRDIRHLTGLLQGTMDDRQKVRSRLERLQHEYRAEGKFYAKQLARLSAEADALEAARAARVLEIEEHEDADKRKEYQRISQWRQQVRGRELRAGRLQDHLAWFQRQARQMEDMLDVTFRPEMPNGAAETIGHYQRRQAHAQSLWAKINDSEAQAAELAAEIRALTQRLADLEEAQAQHGADAAADAASGDLPGTSLVRCRARRARDNARRGPRLGLGAVGRRGRGAGRAMLVPPAPACLRRHPTSRTLHAAPAPRAPPPLCRTTRRPTSSSSRCSSSSAPSCSAPSTGSAARETSLASRRSCTGCAPRPCPTTLT